MEHKDNKNGGKRVNQDISTGTHTGSLQELLTKIICL